MTILDYHQIDKSDWDRVVENSPDGWLYHRSAFIDYAVNRSYQSHSFGVVGDDGKVVAVCPLYFYKESTGRTPMNTFLRKVTNRIWRKATGKRLLDESVNVLHNWYSGPVLDASLRRKGRRSLCA